MNLGGKPGQVDARSTSQVIPTSSPVPEILSCFLVHAHAVDLFLVSRHTGHCWTSDLRAAKIAAKIKHAWLLEACPSTQLVRPLLSTTALAVTHPGEARTFSERPCSFCCQIGPANGIAECRCRLGAPLSPPRPKPSPMVGHLVPAVHATQGAHSTTRHAADPSTVTTNFFSQFTPVTTLICHGSRPLPVFAWP